MKAIPRLYSDVSGSGQVVVLLHGFLASSAYWRKVSELVAQNYRVVAIDLLGFGKSPKPSSSTYDYDDHITAINRTLDELEINDDFTLIGHSMGSLIALRYATLYEHRVKKLILINLPAMLGVDQVRRTIVRSSFLYNIGLRTYLHRVAWGLFRVLYKLKLLPKRVLRQLNGAKSFMFEHTAASRLRSFQCVIEQARVDLDLQAVRVKTILMAGIDDNAVYLDNLKNKLILNPHVLLEVYQTGHHIPIVMPEQVVRTIYE